MADEPRRTDEPADRLDTCLEPLPGGGGRSGSRRATARGSGQQVTEKPNSIGR